MKALRGGALPCLLLLAAQVLSAAGLRVAVVQLHVEERTYASQESFQAAVTAAVEQAVAGQEPDLVVFPEYTCVFLALLQDAGGLRGASSVAEALARVREAHPGIDTVRDVFLERSGEVQRILVEVFAPLARRHRVTIVAGSAFVAVSPGGAGEELRNRAFVFSPDGDLLYTQDKIFLTDFEQDVVGLSAGRLEDASPFVVAGERVGLTLCRDSFFQEWEEPVSRDRPLDRHQGERRALHGRGARELPSRASRPSPRRGGQARDHRMPRGQLPRPLLGGRVVGDRAVGRHRAHRVRRCKPARSRHPARSAGPQAEVGAAFPGRQARPRAGFSRVSASSRRKAAPTAPSMTLWSQERVRRMRWRAAT